MLLHLSQVVIKNHGFIPELFFYAHTHKRNNKKQTNKQNHLSDG